jgi:citrate synthase
MSIKKLEKHLDKITTRMGKAFLSERVVYRGRDLHHDLNQMSWIELYAYGITGKYFNKKELEILNYIWVSTSYPDKSIWPNHITALAATARSTESLGLSIGMTVCEANLYGGTPFKVGFDYFKRAGISIKQGQKLEDFIAQEIEKHKVIYGYGRPLASTDERVRHILLFLSKMGFIRLNNLKLSKLIRSILVKIIDSGINIGIHLVRVLYRLSGKTCHLQLRQFKTDEHLQIAMQTATILKKRNLNMNVAAIYSALGADLGFTADQFHLFMTPCFFAGMPPCFIEAKENEPGTFLPVRCDRIKNEGFVERKWKVETEI